MKRIVIAAAVAALALGGAAQAAKKSKEEVLKDYERTGEFENCLQLTRIDHTRVLDDSTILFVMHGKTDYLNELPHRCPQLGFFESYIHKTSTNNICNTDIITVFDSAANQSLASCGLGKFEKLNKKPAEDSAE